MNLGLFFIAVSYFMNLNITEFKRIAVPLQTNRASLGIILGIGREPNTNPLCAMVLLAGHPHVGF